MVKRHSRDHGMTPSTQHVALILATYAGADGTDIRPTVETVMRVSGRGKATVYAALRDLQDGGWVQQVSKGSGVDRKASVYRLAVPASLERKTPPDP